MDGGNFLQDGGNFLQDGALSIAILIEERAPPI